MDGLPLELPLFLFATFAGAFVAGLSGFAFGLVAASLWLYILTPLQSATLIVAFGLIVQGYSVWKLRRAIDWRKLLPFVVGAALGVPAGVTLLTWSDPRSRPARGWNLSCALQRLCVLSPGIKVGPCGRLRRRRCGGILQRRAGRAYRPCRYSGHNLVRLARLAERCSTRNFPTGGCRGLPDDGDLARSEGHAYGGNDEILPDWLALRHRGKLAWIETLRARR